MWAELTSRILEIGYRFAGLTVKKDGMDAYSAEVEAKTKRLFGWLSENDRHRYAAVEAAKLGHGGVETIARLLSCDAKTIRPGAPARISKVEPAFVGGTDSAGEMAEGDFAEAAPFVFS